MGVSITWCAVREQDAEAFLQQLGLSRTGKIEQMIPRSMISVGQLDTGWRGAGRWRPLQQALRQIAKLKLAAGKTF